MSLHISVLAVAGLASAAAAQGFSLSMIPSSSTVLQGETVTVTVYGDASVGTHILGGGFGLELDLICGEIASVTWNPASWSAFNTDEGFDGSSSYGPVTFGQLVIPGVPPFDVPAAGSETGQAIGFFEIEASTSGGSLGGIIQLVEIEPFSLEVLDINTGEFFNSSQGNLELGNLQFFCPSPSSCAMLGFAGVVCSRRRR